MNLALHKIAAALDVPTADSWTDCALCARSPFGRSGLVRDRMGASFSQWAILARPECSDICAGCVRILAGKPGDQPPPLRLASCAIIEGQLRILNVAGVWDVLSAPPDTPFILSWAESKKKHHALYAGVSTAERMLIGSDSGQIEYRPSQHVDLLNAVIALLAGDAAKKRPSFGRSTIVRGDYSAPSIQKFGPEAWLRHESVIAPCRGSSLLALICAIAPVTQLIPSQEMGMIDSADRDAAMLCGAIARGSSVRQSDGLMFWTGYFRHRVARFSRLPLRDFVSRMMDECRVDASQAAVRELVEMLSGWSAEHTSLVEESLRRRPGLVVALAYDFRNKSSAQRSLL
jgi:hypothetical protein